MNPSASWQQIGRAELAAAGVSAGAARSETVPSAAVLPDKMQWHLEESVRAFERATAIAPERAEVWIELAHALSHLGRGRDAVTTLRAAIGTPTELDLGLIALHAALAELELAAGDRQAALATRHRLRQLARSATGTVARVAFARLGELAAAEVSRGFERPARIRLVARGVLRPRGGRHWLAHAPHLPAGTAPLAGAAGLLLLAAGWFSLLQPTATAPQAEPTGGPVCLLADGSR